MLRPIRTIGAAVAALVLLAVGGRHLAAARAAAAPLTGYLAAPTEQLALPGPRASGEITPEGDIYTGWAEYELSIGPALRPWSQPTRTLPDPAVPEFASQVSDHGITYAERVFTVSVSGQPVVYVTMTARNGGRRAGAASVALGIAYTRGRTVAGTHGDPTSAFRYERPPTASAEGSYFQPGAAFSAGWHYTVTGRDVTRDGQLLLRGPAGARSPTGGTARSPAAVAVRLRYGRRLRPGASTSWTWQIPLQPPAAGAGADAALAKLGPGQAERRLRAFWRAEERGMMRISVPEARVNAVYAANVAAILQSRYRQSGHWVQAVNRLQYQAYWIRDSALETVALDQAGLGRTAGQDLAYLPAWQRPDGLYISRSGQQDGVGQALWEMTEHALLTHSAAYARAQLAGATGAVNWIEHASATDSLGLLPPSTVGDDEFLTHSHITGDNLWAAAGLRSAVILARLAGRPDLAGAWQAIDRRFEAALSRALASDVARAGHITPGLDTGGGYDWGNYQAAYPLPIAGPSSRAVTATIRWFDAHSREGLATYAGGSTLHDYLGFPIFETELSGGQIPAALAGFYAELVHTTAPGYGWEDGMGAWGTRASPVNLAPHGTFSGDFISLLRNLLVDDAGSGIDLLRGVSPAWMAPGDHITVTGAPTRYGTVSFTVTVPRSGGGATLRWRRSGAGSGPLAWMLPYWARRAHTTSGRGVRRSIALRSRTGSIALRWSGALPRVSAARTTAALNRAYRARGRRAPIVRAPGW